MNEPAFWIGPAADPDRYQIGLPVGAGSEGMLYRGSIDVGTDTRLGVAIKMLHPNHRAQLEEWTKRWSAQVELLRSLQVPGVVSVRDGFVGALPHLSEQANPDTASLYLVMNWVDGEPLDTWAAAHSDVGPEERLKLLLPIAGALDLMHSGQATGGTPVIHGDIKPSNIVVRANGETVLVDFGLIRLLPGGSYSSGVTGTPGFVAPEVEETGSYTPAADRFSLGTVAYFLLTGTELRKGESRDSQRQRLEDLHPASPDLVDRVMSMLAPNPEDRPKILANWCAQLRNSSLEQIYQPSRIPPIARTRAPAQSHDTNESQPVSTAPQLDGLPTLSSTPPDREREELSTPVRNRATDHREHASILRGKNSKQTAEASTKRHGRIIAVVTLVVIVLAGAIVGVALSHGGSSGTPHGPATFAFKPQSYLSGLIVDRTWTLSGKTGNQLSGKLTVDNGTAATLHTTYDEVIPKSVAANINHVTFGTPYDKIVNRDPVVQYDLNLAAAKSSTVSYSAEVGKTTGSWSSRLNKLANDQISAQNAFLAFTNQKVLTLASLKVLPPSLSMTVGATGTLTPSGTMSDGSAAPSAALNGVAWSSADPSVADISNRIVTAVGVGTTTITAQSGSIEKSIVVTVTAPAGEQPTTANTPTTQLKPKPTTETTGTPGSTVTPVTAGQTVTPVTPGQTVTPVTPTKPTPIPQDAPPTAPTISGNSGPTFTGHGPTYAFQWGPAHANGCPIASVGYSTVSADGPWGDVPLPGSGETGPEGFTQQVWVKATDSCGLSSVSTARVPTFAFDFEGATASVPGCMTDCHYLEVMAYSLPPNTAVAWVLSQNGKVSEGEDRTDSNGDIDDSENGALDFTDGTFTLTIDNVVATNFSEVPYT